MSVTPDFIGQVYKDTNTGNLWRSNSLTPGDWTLELQNFSLGWLPASSNLSAYAGIWMWYNSPGISSIELLEDSISQGIDIQTNSNIQQISGPNLISIDPSDSYASAFSFQYNTALSSLSFPALVIIGTTYGVGFAIISNTSLTNISLPSLISCPAGMSCTGNSSLATIDFSSLVPTNTKTYSFTNCALSETTVNSILARFVANASYVSGVLRLHGGTSHAPTGQGIVDKATLIGRGCTVTTN